MKKVNLACYQSGTLEVTGRTCVIFGKSLLSMKKIDK